MFSTFHNIQARAICLRLLEQFSAAEDFTLVILRTLTLLSEQALIDRAEQVNFFFFNIKIDRLPYIPYSP